MKPKQKILQGQLEIQVLPWCPFQRVQAFRKLDDVRGVYRLCDVGEASRRSSDVRGGLAPRRC